MGGAGEMGECRESSPGQLSSRCSSSSSLSRDSETVTQVSPSNGADHLHTRSNHDNHPVQEAPPVLSLPPADTQQLLVEKIVKLQKACARRGETRYSGGAHQPVDERD